MASYPTSIPTLTRVGNGIVGGADDPAADGSDTDAVVVVTALQDELEAIATELGTTPSGAAATVGERIGDVEDSVTTLTTRADDVDSALDGIDTTLAGLAADKADDAAVVHLTGDESVDGVKTFLDPPVSITPATTANELVSKAVMDAAISAAVNALVDGAPGALDTLNELAAALGDDASFQATVTAALAGKADKAQNLSDLANIATARTNLGLGGAAVLSVGTTAGTVAAGDDSRLSDTRTPTDNTVATAKVQARAITFAKIQAIATARLLGRTTASSGDVEELTAAQATAMLSAVVGDSGSGGTKGLVPAPAAGDAAAGKFLKADGTFATPAGGGGGWTQVVNDDLTTMSAMTVQSGSWSIVSGQLKHTSTGAAAHRCRVTNKVARLMTAAEVEMRHEGGSGFNRFGIGIGNDGAGSALAYLTGNGASTWTLTTEQDASSGWSSGDAITYTSGNWIKIKVVSSMHAIEVYINDTFVNIGKGATSGGVGWKVFLYTYDSQTSFRNLKVWTLDGP